MVKNIIIGALAGAALAYLYSEQRSGKLEQAYHLLGDHFTKMKHKMKHMHKGKMPMGCMN